MECFIYGTSRLFQQCVCALEILGISHNSFVSFSQFVDMGGILLPEPRLWPTCLTKSLSNHRRTGLEYLWLPSYIIWLIHFGPIGDDCSLCSDSCNLRYVKESNYINVM